MQDATTSRFWSARTLVAVGFLMLLLTSLQGWGMVGVIIQTGQNNVELQHELRRLHNLGLTGSFLSICTGLALLALPIGTSRSKTICRILLPSLLIAPLAFLDRAACILLGSISSTVQSMFYALQALSAFGITVALGYLVFCLFSRSAP